MSRLDELIAELCPNGVEYKTLGEVAHYSKERIAASFVDSHTYVGVDNLLPDKKGKTESTYVPNEGRLIRFVKGDILIGNIRPYLKKIWLAESEGGTNGDVLVIRKNNSEELLSDYLYYVLSSDRFFDYDVQYSKGAKMPRGDKETILKYLIPLPPLEVQREIVRILDAYSERVAELTDRLAAELDARKKQYEYYRDDLCNFTNRPDVPFLSVGELFEFKNGLNKGKEFFGKGSPIVNFTDVFNNRWMTKETLKGLVEVTDKEKELYGAKKNDVFFTRTSETQEEIGMTSVLLDDIEGCVFSGFVLRARPKTDLLLPKFCSYYFSSYSMRKDIVRYSTFTTRALTSGSKLSKLMFPLPSLAEQERIVAILDRFDKLCNDISEGIPAEIEARRKQYEHYRDRLLTFKEKTA